MRNEKYYYLRDKKQKPVITVCLLKDDHENISRGIAICSDKDQFRKKSGRSIAKIRARLALDRKIDTLPIIRITEATAMLSFLGFFKAAFDPILTKHEQELFQTRKIMPESNLKDEKSIMYTFREFVIPGYMTNSIKLYLNEGVQPGRFLTAIICNDLFSAVAYADDDNLPNIPAYTSYFYNEAPGICHGSKEIMKAWLINQRKRFLASTFGYAVKKVKIKA